MLQTYDLLYGSQLSQTNLELMSGMKLEQNSSLEFMDKELRNYTLVVAKNLMTVEQNRISKSLPNFFSDIRMLDEDDLKLLHSSNLKNPLFIGMLRSGSKIINYDLCIDGEKALAEHILISSSTGKGKSNLTSCILWSNLDKDYSGIIVLDPHDEYYGRNHLGLKDHPCNKIKNQVIYYSKNPIPGTISLKINLKAVKPSHLNGVISLTDAQHEALIAFHRKYQENWISAILKEEKIEGFHETTLIVIKRKLSNLLDVKFVGDSIICQGIFDITAGETTVNDICKEVEKNKTIIIDTSNISSGMEILVGSLISSEILNKYKRYKTQGLLRDKPVVSIVIEEAPRVLGKEVLEKGQNIFSTIAREGRKFKVGLIGITQLPSLIPRTILANMNTKIILGMEMGVERRAIIESASQDLSDDDKNIASLDKGEAIVTSNFLRFATPIKIPFFEDVIKKELNKKEFNHEMPNSDLKEKVIKQNFIGVNGG